MRAALSMIIALVGCAPEVGYNTYLCGYERDCPDGQTCDGATARCVNPSLAKPFMCSEDSPDREPDDVPAMGFSLPDLTCISPVTLVKGCLHEGETEDWFRIKTPEGCAALVVYMKLTYAHAFEEVSFEIGDTDGTILEAETMCGPNDGALDDVGVKCLKRTLASNTEYTIRVKADGTLSCDGDCAFNRYSMDVRFGTP